MVKQAGINHYSNRYCPSGLNKFIFVVTFQNQKHLKFRKSKRNKTLKTWMRHVQVFIYNKMLLSELKTEKKILW